VSQSVELRGRTIRHVVSALAIAFFISCIVHPATADAQYFDHSYAIVIGIDSYEHPNAWPTLQYAVKDAQAITEFLTGQGFTVITFYGVHAKKAAIISAMEDDLAPKLHPSDRVFVFFAGHGKTETLGGEKRGYIVPYDGGRGSSLISMAELKLQSSYMGVARSQLFIMDSCYGGLLASTRDSLVDIHVPHYLKEVTDRIARQVLTAGGEGQEVLDGGPKGHSIFVDALLEGLQDGLADLNGDGYITFHELVAYVTPRASNDYETPGDGVLPGHQEGEFVFRNPKGTGRPIVEIPVPASATKKRGEPNRTAAQHVALGDARYGVGDLDGAKAEYRDAVSNDPANAQAHYLLGVAFGRNKEWDEEIKEERIAIQLKPDLQDAHYNLGGALGHKGDWDEAIKEEREAIRLKADDADAHAQLGRGLSRKRSWDEAIRETREATRLKPDDADYHAELGIELSEKSEWDEEIKEERTAIRLEPNSTVAHFNLAFALEHKGDRQSAVEEYRKAFELGDLRAQTSLDKLLKETNASANPDSSPALSSNASAIPLSPNPATPMMPGAGTAPKQSPASATTTSAYQELQKAIDSVQVVSNDWAGSIMSAEITRSRTVNRYQDKTAPAVVAAQRQYELMIARADERRLEHWKAISQDVNKAHSNAIARMKVSGPSQVTPNQVHEDDIEFNKLTAQMGQAVTDTGNPDRGMIQPLSVYLGNLQKKLGDYQEGMGPSP